MAGASDFTPGKLSALGADGGNTLVDDGTFVRRKARCAFQEIIHFLTIANAFVLDAKIGGDGANSVAYFDMGVRTRVRELSIANRGAILGDLLLMSLDSLAASTPHRYSPTE